MSCISIRNIKEKKTVDLAKSWPGITIKSWYGVNEIKKQKNKNLRKHSETKTGSEEATGIVPWRRNKVSEVVQNSTKLRTFAGNAGRTFKVLKKFYSPSGLYNPACLSKAVESGCGESLPWIPERINESTRPGHAGISTTTTTTTSGAQAGTVPECTEGYFLGLSLGIH